MDLGQQVWQLITNPNVSYLLLIVGLLMLLVAVTTPGTGVAEVVAIVALALAAIGLIQLSANFAGVLLVIVGFVLFAIDATATAHGALTLGGALSILLGSLLLFPVREGSPGLSGWLIAGVTLSSAGLSVLVISAFVRVRQQSRVDAAAQNVVGVRGLVKTTVAPSSTGTAQIGGQLWTIAAEETIEPGVEVIVLSREGLTLHVKRVNPQPVNASAAN
jgi:membrane-bound serine protease (ClpP class)